MRPPVRYQAVGCKTAHVATVVMIVAKQRGKQKKRNKTRDSVLDPVFVVGMTRQSLESPDLIHGLFVASCCCRCS